MKNATPPRECDLPTTLLVDNVRIYLQIKSAYEQCDEEIQAAVSDMIEIATDKSATEDERQRAMSTIVEALFPSSAVDLLAHCDKVRNSTAAQAKRAEMVREEETFSERLARALELRSLTQEELGRRIGVGQSAIANLLNRNCRPQKRTVIRIAAALDVPPADLWPGIQVE